MVNFNADDSCDMKMISTAMFGGTEVHIVPVEYVGTAYMSRRRRHKKKRTDKKWLKRYGYVQRYRDDRVLMINGCFWMTSNTYERLKKSGDEQGWMT